MSKSQIEAILQDADLVDEIRRRAVSEVGFPRLEEWGLEPETLRALVADETPGPEPFASRPLTEAIVIQFGRPSLLIQNGTFELPTSDTWKDRLAVTKSKIERAIPSVGRVELRDHPSYDWVGTGWVIADNVIVTNRHVAMAFAEKKGRRFVFSVNPDNRAIRAAIDFREEHRQPQSFEATVDKVLFIEDYSSARPDIAFLQLKRARNLPTPIPVATMPDEPGALIAVIGYPARDDRNNAGAMLKIFGDIFNVKRLSPGAITATSDPMIFTHDCSTLGGNSGSVILDLESGEAVGLHFGGTYRTANYAVKAAVLLDALARQRIQVPVARPAPAGGERGLEAVEEAPLGQPGDYANRQGYQPNFLGGGEWRVPLPTLKASHKADAAEMVAAAAGSPRYLVPYTHFSLVMSKSRRLIYYSASNIDGNQLRRVPRAGIAWRLDPRLPSRYQAGAEIYADNDLDRGHMTRREDPVWGTGEEAKQANSDTFHYTNAAPQHKDFNQKTWLQLEDYVLDNADVANLKVSVFTGPIFKEDDLVYRGLKLPREFWKIVVIVNAATGKLSATAYILSQASLLPGVEFVYGQFKTYQVPIKYVESKTGLKFGKLPTYDPKGKEEALPVHVVSGPEDLVL